MKKIFAIALALVMVLSMASAFAWCPTISWACDTYVCTNGTGSVEVVPYVKGNACNGNSFTANTCAGAVNGDNVYFGIKVTVEADASADWWAQAAMSVSTKGLDAVKFGETAFSGFGAGDVDNLVLAVDAKNELTAGEYYLVYKTNTFALVKAADYAPATDGVFSAKVTDASVAKVCVKLTSAANIAQEIEVNGYKVSYVAAEKRMEIYKGSKHVTVAMDADNKVEQFLVWTSANEFKTVKTYNADKTAFWTTADEKLDWSCDEYGKFLKGLMEYFVLDFGTCVTEKAFKANFGWDDKAESCFSWSDKVQAVVDAECVVAIPKTGDMSVLAWLF